MAACFFFSDCVRACVMCAFLRLFVFLLLWTLVCVFTPSRVITWTHSFSPFIIPIKGSNSCSSLSWLRLIKDTSFSLSPPLPLSLSLSHFVFWKVFLFPSIRGIGWLHSPMGLLAIFRSVLHFAGLMPQVILPLYTVVIFFDMTAIMMVMASLTRRTVQMIIDEVALIIVSRVLTNCSFCLFSNFFVFTVNSVKVKVWSRKNNKTSNQTI